jgi:hypothetical protein
LTIIAGERNIKQSLTKLITLMKLRFLKTKNVRQVTYAEILNAHSKGSFLQRTQIPELILKSHQGRKGKA